jgi:hypothetical protein
MGKLSKVLKAIDDKLSMREADRLQRARDQGFDTDTVYYHGTNKDFDAFDPDRAIGSQFWSTTDRAAIEGGEVGAQGNGVIKELYAKVQNPAGWDEYNRLGIDELIRDGYDGVKMPDPDGSTTLLAFNPNQYRSVNAAFDPAKKDSSNLLAQLGGAGIVGAATLGSDESEAGAGERVFPTMHPKVKNSDGSISHLRIGTFGFDDGVRAIPTMVGGKQLTQDKALTIARMHGLDNYPVFSDENQANEWIERNHSVIGEDGTLPSAAPINNDGIYADEYPTLDRIGTALNKVELPILGKPFEGTANYLQRFGEPKSNWERLKDSYGITLDLL